ncbi:MAG: V-type ATP synthase subunit I [Inconstantimicrobium porci]|uniref:V-type ATP synthase subunit I n=1 Tax=Inconstantimicrobium porci TaxID=2652291 RepID=UPI00240A4BC4|nr:V-type ATP synthase subunit I [Inconstantimicrobium porci]MDD6770225.1 V-type ATP synthase subunit I [Inconstantimicrobium porci]MDY5912499.1 V-type ATP synthase subunit I [Inconstantimicrobium porci]
MAIVKMNKFTLLSFESNQDKILEELQGFEGVQFIDLQDPEVIKENEIFETLDKGKAGKDLSEYEDSLSKVKFSLDLLKGYVPKEGMLSSVLNDKKVISYKDLKESVEQGEWKNIYHSLKEKDDKISELNNEKSKNETDIEGFKPWQNFDAPLSMLKELKETSYFVGSCAVQYEQSIAKDLEELNVPYFVEHINKTSKDIYFMILCSKEHEELVSDAIKKYGFNSLHLSYDESPSKIIESCKERIAEINAEEDAIKAEMAKFADKVEVLQLAYEYFTSLVERQNVKENFVKTDKVTAIIGWNEVDNNKKLEERIKNIVGDEYYLTFEEVKEEERENNKVPIKLKNGGFAGPFESIVAMYGLPQYKEVDPTPILSVFYFLFFGMMLSDAGYGLMMALVCGFVMMKTKDREKKNTYKLFFFCGLSTILWGAIYGGWFGDLLSKYLGLNIPILINPTTDIMTMFIMSLAFGIIHIFVGLGIKAYLYAREKQYAAIVFDVVSIYFIIIGAVMLLAGMMAGMTSLEPVGKILLIAGIVILVLTAGRESKSIVGKAIGGLNGVYGLTSYLGDIISYSRLMGLGLATGFIANALNLIINLFPVPFRWIIGPVLFIALHGFNLAINALGSYVHTARLQYLEFFNKFYEGGGNKFNPFKLSGKFVKVTDNNDSVSR